MSYSLGVVDDSKLVSAATASSSAAAADSGGPTSVIRDPKLNPLTADGKAAVRRPGATTGASTALSESERREYFDERDDLRKKARLLAMCIKASRRTVIHTGAGISTAAKIPDYRGPKGVWTLRAKGEAVKMEITLEQAVPTYSHMALKTMIDKGMLSHIVTTNVDGLHRRSGINRKHLSELHGDIYLEYCNKCGCEYLRTYDVTKTRRGSSRFTGRICEKSDCDGKLRDSIIAFGENLPREVLTVAMRETAHADLCIVIGSSMRVSPACNIPSLCYHKRGTFALINLQKTPYDKFAHIRIHAKCDEFMRYVCDELGLKVEEFDASAMVAAHEADILSSSVLVTHDTTAAIADDDEDGAS